MENAGIIEVICGPMFSGKTKALINRAKKELIDNQDILVFKPSVDNRYSEVNVVSHDRKKIECIVIKSSYEILNYIDSANVFLIDEAQFFDIEIVSICKKLVKTGKKVILAGLDKDYEAKPFGQMENLMSISNNITKLTSKCSLCGNDAEYSFRLTNNTKQVLIGEAEKYEPRCKTCYNNK